MSTTETAVELVVGTGDAGIRLDQFLAAPVGSRAQAQALIDAGRVTVDGQARPKRHLLSGGERVVVHHDIDTPGERNASDDSAEQVPFEVAYEDAYLIVVDKPAGVVVHPARGHRTGTLAQALAGRAAGGDEPWRAGIVHRLDRGTSGLLVVAKSDEVHRALKEELKTRALHREYLALVNGLPEARTGTIEAPIGRHRRQRVLMSIDSEDPREARTHFELERAFARTALLRIELDTGRTHQIRVHMAAIGHPVCGDPQYGGAGVKGAYGLRRQFLHAARLAFPHPVSGEPVEVTSPLPEDLRAALALAEAEV